MNKIAETLIICFRLRIFFQFLIRQKTFDYTILIFIALNCITLAMERPSIPPESLVSYKYCSK